MLKLPNPVFKEVFYGVLLADLLKTKPSIAPVVRAKMTVMSDTV